MPLFEIVLGVEHNCQLGKISRRFSSLILSIWLNPEFVFVELVVHGNNKDQLALQELQSFGDVYMLSSREDTTHMVARLTTDAYQLGVMKCIEKLGLLTILPIRMETGWGEYRVVALRHSDIKQLFQCLRDDGFSVQVKRKTDFKGVITGSSEFHSTSLLSDLTRKQMDALLTAYVQGYYQIPRKSDLQAIAAFRGVPRTTFQEHLKKAENKIVSAIIPRIQFMKHLVS
ncbi:MAG: helix-turn-helix domain-containing protein [Candidatus Thorarchaeota archaeon]